MEQDLVARMNDTVSYDCILGEGCRKNAVFQEQTATDIVDTYDSNGSMRPIWRALAASIVS